MNQMQRNELLPQDDLLKTILADLRRTVREYTTATTESSCPTVRRMFTDLTNSTLQLQGDLYALLSRQNIYSAPAQATRQQVDRSLQEAQTTQQRAHQFIQQRLQQSIPSNQYVHPQNVSEHQANSHGQGTHYI